MVKDETASALAAVRLPAAFFMSSPSKGYGFRLMLGLSGLKKRAEAASP
jgi:hypothetical protein